MNEPKAFESYPIYTTIAFWSVGLLNIAIGFYLLSLINSILSFLYIAYVTAVELQVYREGCVSCWYYGKSCASRRGRIAPKIFKRQDKKRFCEKKVTWKNLLPTILVSAIPVAAGVYVMALGFTYVILGLTIIPLLIWFVGNPLVYGNLVCPHCRQGRICCPASEFFGKKAGKERK